MTIKKVTLEIGAQQIELTEDQARDLQVDLKRIFGETEYQIYYQCPYGYSLCPNVNPGYSPSIIGPNTVIGNSDCGDDLRVVDKPYLTSGKLNN